MVSIGLSHLLLVPGLHQPKHHLGQRVAGARSGLAVSLLAGVGLLVPHAADEVGADLPLALAHLKRPQRGKV